MIFQLKTTVKILVLVLVASAAVFGLAGIASAQSYCSYHSQQRCNGNNLYWYDSCGNQQDLIQYCQNGCYNNTCQNYNNYNNYNGCTSNYSQRCVGSYLYWYDSCGNQQGQIQYCSNGCYNGVCGNYNNYNNNYNYGYNGSCVYHSYKLCSGNNVYWYDSCGNMQDLYQSCSGGMTCQYGQCTYHPIITPAVPITPIVYNSYVAHYRLACYSNNVYWYDSTGSVNSLYKNCTDTNSCTLDSCGAGKCSNVLKCDGSTCAVGSADYNAYCAGGVPNNPNNTQKLSSLSVSFFAKPDQTSSQWQKTVQVGPNGRVYFMISVANNSSAQADNVMVAANIPADITSLGNLQINGVQVSGDIVAGVGIGSLAPGSAKSVTFEGKTGSVPVAATKQAVAVVNVSGATASDTVSVNLVSATNTAASVATSPGSGFWDFVKKWYLWILVGLVLIFLFIVVFRRLSSNN